MFDKIKELIYIFKESMNGVTVVNLTGIGKIIKCTVKENSHGTMVANILGNILMTRSMVTEFLNGLMDAYIREDGLMENKKGMEFIKEAMVWKEKANGKREKGFDGLRKQKKNKYPKNF
jgi:hypothetical protein